MFHQCNIYKKPIWIYFHLDGRFKKETMECPAEYPSIEIDKIELSNGKDLLFRHNNFLDYENIFEDIVDNYEPE